MPIDNPVQKKILKFLKRNGITDQRVIEKKFGFSRERARELRVLMSRDRKNSPKTIAVSQEGNVYFWTYPEITWLGETSFRNQKRQFGIRREDRTRHVYCVGKTGCGKSNLLLNMAIQDILAGRGVCVIDVHGELAEKL